MAPFLKDAQKFPNIYDDIIGPLPSGNDIDLDWYQKWFKQ